METRKTIPGYISDHPEFREIGERMMGQWEEGVRALTEPTFKTGRCLEHCTGYSN